MNTSTFAALENALILTLRAALPQGVEISTMTPAAAAQFKPRLGHPGRVNLMLLRVAPSAAVRAATAPAGPSSALAPTAAFDLTYMITAIAGIDPAADGGVPHLLECVTRAVLRHPVQKISVSPASGAPIEKQVTVELPDLPFDQTINLWRALGLELQPAILCLARSVTVE